MNKKCKLLTLPDDYLLAKAYYICPDGRIYDDHSTEIEPYKDSRGYKSVKLQVNIISGYDDETPIIHQRTKIFRVHRLVAINFVYGRNPLRDKVFIKDGNKDNVDARNLMWCTQQEINGLILYRENGIDDYIDYFLSKGTPDKDVIDLLIRSGYLKHKLFKKHYIKSMIKLYKDL